jgi:hypothetical protein
VDEIVLSQARKQLGITEYWCGRMSRHSSSLAGETVHSSNQLVGDEGQAIDMSPQPRGIYERFRRGLLEFHSQVCSRAIFSNDQTEREYIESLRETECLQVFQRHVAEVWRLHYELPSPTSPRTFVVLLLSKELVATDGRRCFMNSRPDCGTAHGSLFTLSPCRLPGEAGS